MPVIEGADLTSVSTDRDPYPENEYLVTIKESEIKDGKTLIMKTRIDEPEEFAGREFWDFINLVQNDGKRNEIGLTTIKRYLEAVYGKGSAEAEASPPDTDVLNGMSVRLLLTESEYEDKKDIDPATGKGRLKRNNKVKRIFPA